MNDETLTQVLSIVKARFDYTWLDAATEAKLKNMIKNAVSFLNRISGKDLTYTTEGAAQSLMLTHVMYERENALDDFYTNYRNELVALINRAKVEKYANKQETQSE